MILGVLESYYTAPFLVGALIVGYLMFFFYFYKTDYWGSIDWSERFFFGFLVGMFVMSVCALVSFPLAYFLYALHLEGLYVTAFYAVPLFFLLAVIALRINKGIPLSSKRVFGEFQSFVSNHRSYWPWFLIIVSIIAYMWLGWNNPFFDSASKSLWLDFIVILNFTVFLSFGLLTWLVVLFSAVPNKVSWYTIFLSLPTDIFSLCFFSFYRKKKHVWMRYEDEYWV